MTVIVVTDFCIKFNLVIKIILKTSYVLFQGIAMSFLLFFPFVYFFFRSVMFPLSPGFANLLFKLMTKVDSRQYFMYILSLFYLQSLNIIVLLDQPTSKMLKLHFGQMINSNKLLMSNKPL